MLAGLFAERYISMSTSLVNQVHQDAIKESVNYAITKMHTSIICHSRQDLWDLCINIDKEHNNRDARASSLVIEFGVYGGYSINYFAKIFSTETIYGFDSFEGLQENWDGYSHLKGAFDRKGVRPEVASNVALVDGWISDTLPRFVNSLQGRKVRFIHMDMDTYSPTFFALNTLRQNLEKDSIVIFDEYFGYPGWRDHEFKAWREFTETHGIEYKYLGYSNFSVAVQIKNIRDTNEK